MNITPLLLIYGLGGSELLIILVILLILFGGSRLPSLAKGLGESIRSFKQGVSEEPEDKPEAKKDHTKAA
jgi:sec-independent protein translocase protein TatA